GRHWSRRVRRRHVRGTGLRGRWRWSLRRGGYWTGRGCWRRGGDRRRHCYIRGRGRRWYVTCGAGTPTRAGNRQERDRSGNSDPLHVPPTGTEVYSLPDYFPIGAADTPRRSRRAPMPARYSCTYFSAERDHETSSVIALRISHAHSDGCLYVSAARTTA